MTQLTHRSVVSAVGAIIGFTSLFTPWVLVSESRGGLSASEGVSPAQLVASLFNGGSSSGPTDPAITAWQQRAVVGSWLWLIGSFILGVGCLLSAVQVFAKSWVGSIAMLVGIGMGGAGIASFSATFPTSLGIQVSVGPNYGLGIAAVGSGLALAALFIKDMPLSGAAFPSQTGLFPAGPTYPYSMSRPGSIPAQVPVVVASPAVQRNEKFCPTCGNQYPADYNVCPKDSSELRSIG